MVHNLEDFRQDANDALSSSMKHLERKEFDRHYKILAIARELYHLMEDVEMIKTCNSYFEEGRRKGLLILEEQRGYEYYAQQKVNCLMEIQKRLRDCKRLKP